MSNRYLNFSYRLTIRAKYLTAAANKALVVSSARVVPLTFSINSLARSTHPGTTPANSSFPNRRGTAGLGWPGLDRLIPCCFLRTTLQHGISPPRTHTHAQHTISVVLHLTVPDDDDDYYYYYRLLSLLHLRLMLGLA